VVRHVCKLLYFVYFTYLLTLVVSALCNEIYVCSLSLSDNILFQLNEGVNMFQRQFVSELRRCEEMERQLSKCLHVCLLLRACIHH